ncbi:MAG: antitoxin [Aliihoeflea sp.]|uniref:antitoxin n=1 Tax=Aliihoeflea sp. TaxID=2608088 RepID=UPI0040339899
MTRIAKVFINGRSQAVRLPAEFRFNGTEVYVSRNESGDVVLSEKPNDWNGFLAALGKEKVGDFLSPEERRQDDAQRDPFAGWTE